ncbi:carbohydrate ABC transporter permease [Rhizobium mayense]|uniref:Carbohydrate ABC transporter permease n=1 Tax=Rhizobium mayense TaxID=1312184 RepID=A0ABT7JZT4_9HYPH|nr:carbohydrate ABC transporter permease [Rhizobium mayense]MDL2401865.1 carbohydrate ABC transporter permease [Rhizobium mayense]
MSALLRGKRRKFAYHVAVYAGLFSLLAIFVFPLLWIVGISLKTREQIFTNPPVFFWIPTFENYTQVLTQSDFLASFGNSLITTSCSVALSLLIGIPASYTFARFRFPGQGFAMVTLLIMRMLPPVAILLPLFILFKAVGLSNTRASVIIAYTTFSLPLIVWVMKDYFANLPKELEEAAYIDGASRMLAFRKIVLPLARPGIVTAAILSLLLAWNDFIFAAILTNNATRTSPVLLASYAGGETGTNWGAITASGVLVVIPVIIFSLIVQKHLVQGLSSGTVK